MIPCRRAVAIENNHLLSMECAQTESTLLFLQCKHVCSVIIETVSPHASIPMHFNLHTLSDAGNCLLQFTEQPITSAQCNIYGEEEITLTCTISSEHLSRNAYALDPSGITIKWYYNNGTESELTAGASETRREGGNGDPVVISSILTISAISQHGAANLAKGSYYCRVNVAGWPGFVSNSSQQFSVLSMDEYFQIGISCSHTTFIAKERACAVCNTSGAVVTEESSESLTLSTLNPTDVMIIQEVDTTVSVQSTFSRNEGISEIWIYVLVAIVGAFLITIVVLIVFIIKLILMTRNSQARRNNTDRKLYNYL